MQLCCLMPYSWIVCCPCNWSRFMIMHRPTNSHFDKYPAMGGYCQCSVSDSNPVCSHERSEMSDSDTTEHRLHCTVSFKGNWAPVMEWRMENSDLLITDGVTNRTTFNESLTSTLIVNVPLGRSTPNYTHTTSFSEDMKPPNTNATNVPDYNYTCLFSLTTTCPDNSLSKKDFLYSLIWG